MNVCTKTAAATPPATTATATIRVGLPKGRMHDGVMRLLRDAGLRVEANGRGYRPSVSLDGHDAKILKAQNIVEMLQAGSRDIGFAGADWVAELGADLVELLDTGLDRVRLVAAAPRDLLDAGHLPRRPLVVASEYQAITRRWIEDRGLDATFVRSYGATEVFPPEDADCIVDNTATGATLRANGLQIVDELMTSTTRLYANPRSLEDPGRREHAERLVMLLRSVLEARRRVLVEVNVRADRLEQVIAVLPCMREPTTAQLHGGGGFAVKAAVRRDELPAVIPLLKAAGGTDVIVTEPSQIVV